MFAVTLAWGMLAAPLMVQDPQMPPRTEQIIARSWQQTLVVGHRGAAAYEPENTLPAFERSIADGAVATELDVFLSKDGAVVVMHDPTLDRTTSLSGRVDEHTREELVAAGVPMLEDVADLTKGRTVLVVEIKAGDGIEPKVAEIIREREMEAETIIFSFNPDIVKNMRAVAPELYTVWLCAAPMSEDRFEWLLEMLGDTGADAVGFQFRNVSGELVAFLHAREIPVFVWTVPPGDEIARLHGLGVNFIITDHPGEVIDQLGELGPRPSR